MANIPVERTSTGTPWWLWLLGLLLLAGLIWLIAGLLDDDDDVDVAEVDAVETVDPVAVPEPGMDLSNLYVTRVPGDRVFYVAPSEAQADMETLVILDQNMSPDVPGIEGQVDINPGQMVDLSAGTMEPLGDMNLAGMGLSDAEASAMTPDTEVIRIDGGDVDIYEQDLQNVEVGE